MGKSSKKTGLPYKTIDEYLALVPPDKRQALQDLRSLIKAQIPNPEEVISYGIPIIKHQGLLVGFASAKKFCTFHIMSEVIANKLRNEIVPFEMTVASVHFTPEKPLPPELVVKIVKLRMAENEAKQATRDSIKKIAKQDKK
jgi:uncharacterized protein YdhG (YjbR/CyaY superfamily)